MQLLQTLQQRHKSARAGLYGEHQQQTIPTANLGRIHDPDFATLILVRVFIYADWNSAARATAAERPCWCR